jgi:RNA 3'-terminal phosphate cyclase (ATP)
MPQHLTAVKAVAAMTDAAVSGDRLGSTELVFVPQHSPKADCYTIDVAEEAQQGSAGAVTLILQTMLLPLALASESSVIVLRGGTHVKWSPPFDDILAAYLPALRRMGFRVDVELQRCGWYPTGGGEVVCRIAGSPVKSAGGPWPIKAVVRGALKRISGRALASKLPAHIPERMTKRALATLADFGVTLNIEPQTVTATCAGAGIFLLAEYEPFSASFSAYGRLGMPSEAVADEASAKLRDHHSSGATIEQHLADQLLLPLALADGSSAFTVSQTTGHLWTNAWTIGQLGAANVTIKAGHPCSVQIEPQPPALAYN